MKRTALLLTALALHPTAVPANETTWKIELPEQGRTITDARWIGPDGVVLREGRDEAHERVDVDALVLEDQRLGDARRGKLRPDLHAHLATLSEGEVLEVVFWLVEPDSRDIGLELRARAAALPEPSVAEGIKALRREYIAEATARYSSGNARFAAEVERAGGAISWVADAWPLVFAHVDGEMARGLATDPQVGSVYRSMPQWFEEGNFAQGTLRTPFVWNDGIVADGSVRVLVNDTDNVTTSSPWIPPVILLNEDSFGSHASGVAGNICNFHETYRASCYALPQLYSGGGSGDVFAPQIWGAGISAGIDFGNCSWWTGQKGQINFLDRWFDGLIRDFSIMMFKSNGNQGNSSTPYATTPGNGYNVTSTGSYTDENTIDWSDDYIWNSSSFWNPKEGHDKPEVASPGACVATTSTSSIQSCFGGTSSASPLTAGVAALVSSGENMLLTQMTTVKALLMATAWHNLEGSAVLSEKDGVGGVHAAAAHAAAKDHQWWHREITAADFQGQVIDVSIPLLEGDETRIVALWFSRPNPELTQDPLQMDLDLTVLDPDRSVIASSINPFNPFEIAAFVPQMSGDYTVRLTRQRFDGVSEPLSVVWSTRSDSGTARVELTAGSTFSPGGTPSLRFTDEFHGSKAYAAWASLTGPTGINLGDGYTLPIGFDILSYYTLLLPGFSGTLDSVGTALATFPVPPDPPLIGVPIHFSVVVANSLDSPLDLLSIAPDTTFVVTP